MVYKIVRIALGVSIGLCGSESAGVSEKFESVCSAIQAGLPLKTINPMLKRNAFDTVQLRDLLRISIEHPRAVTLMTTLVAKGADVRAIGNFQDQNGVRWRSTLPCEIIWYAQSCPHEVERCKDILAYTLRYGADPNCTSNTDNDKEGKPLGVLPLDIFLRSELKKD